MSKVRVDREVVMSAADELDRLADDTMQSHTINGVWTDEDDAHEEYLLLKKLVEKLQAAL